MNNGIKDYSMLMLDTEGKFQNWDISTEKIKGYKKEDVIGRFFGDFHTVEDQQNGKAERLLEEARRNGSALDEGWRVRKNNTRFWAGVDLNAIYNDQHEVIGYMKLTRDLTKLREAKRIMKQKEVLKAKNRELEQFVYAASHDLQEPLRTVSSFVSLMEDHIGDKLDETSRRFFLYIIEGCSRMKDLVRGLLDYSRIGKTTNPIIVDSQALINDLIKDLSRNILENKASIQVEELPKLKVYQTELRLLFQNLITNAIKFSKEGVNPEVLIKATEKAHHWVFSVSDNGIGIPKKYQERIFMVFQRLHTQEEYQGTGIGLAHCYKIVELHHGKIWVDSAPNTGSTFFFTISKNLT
ncbi:MAG: ATP-binding protein [Bacteroidota bacterium]